MSSEASTLAVAAGGCPWGVMSDLRVAAGIFCDERARLQVTYWMSGCNQDAGQTRAGEGGSQMDEGPLRFGRVPKYISTK